MRGVTLFKIHMGNEAINMPCCGRADIYTNGDCNTVRRGLRSLFCKANVSQCVRGARQCEVNATLACSRVYQPPPCWAYIACGKWEIGLLPGQVGIDAPYVWNSVWAACLGVNP